VDYFEVREEAGVIILAPLKPSRAEEARAKLARLGIAEDDIEAAVEWARKS